MALATRPKMMSLAEDSGMTERQQLLNLALWEYRLMKESKEKLAIRFTLRHSQWYESHKQELKILLEDLRPMYKKYATDKKRMPRIMVWTEAEAKMIFNNLRKKGFRIDLGDRCGNIFSPGGVNMYWMLLDGKRQWCVKRLV